MIQSSLHVPAPNSPRPASRAACWLAVHSDGRVLTHDDDRAAARPMWWCPSALAPTRVSHTASLRRCAWWSANHSPTSPWSITRPRRAGSLRLALNDGQRESAGESDAGTHPGTLRVNTWQHVAVTGDGGPKIITWIVDGVLNDGGAVRDYGWGRFDAVLADVNGRTGVMLAPKLSGQFRQLRIYPRPLRTSEVVGNWRAGAPERRP
ncbi:MAG: hypothetical protein NT090_04360 [Acidobacteria bacterium]|nr:hypothetical protein [Acidobacteriota bacterium]